MEFGVYDLGFKAYTGFGMEVRETFHKEGSGKEPSISYKIGSGGLRKEWRNGSDSGNYYTVQDGGFIARGT